MVLLTYFIVLSVLSVILGIFFNLAMGVKPFIGAWWTGLGICLMDVLFVGALCVFLHMALIRAFS